MSTDHDRARNAFPGAFNSDGTPTQADRLAEQIRSIADKLPNIADCDKAQIGLYKISRELATLAQGTTPAAGVGEQAQAEPPPAVSIYRDGRIVFREAIDPSCAEHLVFVANRICGITQEKTNG